MRIIHIGSQSNCRIRRATGALTLNRCRDPSGDEEVSDTIHRVESSLNNLDLTLKIATSDASTDFLVQLQI